MIGPEPCPRCGSTPSPGSPGGLCPRCLFQGVLDNGMAPATTGGVLESLSLTGGPMPRVLLRDTEDFNGPGPVVRPTSDEMPEEGPRAGRLQLFGEIARGGMGAVLKGRDNDLGRDLAVKVLLEKHAEDTGLLRRFVEEAQIAGQLQHPGVVPVYELGAFADRRPYFAMKLVKGRTLAEVMAERARPEVDHPRLLAIFLDIAQTMAYAHARGVIHRDLKPSNVMVGSFGEVQVMDWGLAKVLPRGGVVDDREAGKVVAHETVIATSRSGSGSDLDLSRAGSVMGTPSYMAPEQARGENDQLDERADVFALGSILCEVLTGHPAFTGRTSGEILRKAARGEVAEALARLEGCGADAELVALARDSIAAEAEDRPRDAGSVVDRLHAYLTGVQEKLRATELARAAESARAEEAKRTAEESRRAAEAAEARARAESRSRRLTLALAASVLALATMGGLGVFYDQHERSTRAATVAKVIGQASTLRDLARAEPEDVARWRMALTAVQQAEGVAGGDPEALRQLAQLRVEVQAGADAADRDKTLLDRLVDIRSAEADDEDGSATDADYADAFREARIEIANLPPAEAGARIKARPQSVALALAGSLDDWASIRRSKRSDATGASRLGEAARVADPDPWRNELRTTLDQADKVSRLAGLQALARKANFEELGPISLQLLGVGLNNAGDNPLAESVLRDAQRRHPRDVWVNYVLAGVLERLSRRDEAIRFYTAARSIRPETAHALAHALEERGDSDEAIAVFRDLKALRPGDTSNLFCLGRALEAKGLSREASEVLEAAVAAGRKAIRLKPDNASAHTELGSALGTQGKLDEAIAECREAIRLKPDFANAHFNLGSALGNQGKLDEAIAEFSEAIQLKPDFAEAHVNLGGALCIQGKLDEAIAACREAIRLKPDYANAHNNLGSALGNQRKLDEAIAEYREAIRLKPDNASNHGNLGSALYKQGKLDEAIAECREAIRLKPDFAPAHYNLGVALMLQGKLDEAVAAYREAIRLRPDDATAHCNLGSVLRIQGDYAGSLAMFRKGHELGSKQPGWRRPSAQWVAEAEQMAALAERLPSLLKGEEHPKDNADRLALAEMCYDTKRHAAAARFWAEALEADPKLGDDRRVQHRYNAACAASLAAAGQGKDDPPPDEAARTKLREQALGWLKAELAAWSKILESGPPEARPFIAQTLNHWKQDTDLVGIRDAEALARLPEAERKDWQALWAEVDALLAKISGG